MTHLIIEGREAALPDSLSFDYLSENRHFTDADDFTLSITLPLRGCRPNEAIFGNINRLDTKVDKTSYDAELICANFHKYGTVQILTIERGELKVQFLEGKSVSNSAVDINQTYINTLKLGYPETSLAELGKLSQNADDFIGGYDSVSPDPQGVMGKKCVALPWINDSTGEEQNILIKEPGATEPVYNEETNEYDIVTADPSNPGNWYYPRLRGETRYYDQLLKGDIPKFKTAQERVSWMPYLIYVTRLIFEKIGYRCDFSAWEASNKRYLLCCNVLPAVWKINDFGRALPHWTVTEYVANIEPLVGLNFDIDTVNKTVKCVAPSTEADTNTAQNVVVLSEVFDDFSADISLDEKSAGFIGAKNIRYAERGDDDWKLEDCSWIRSTMPMLTSTFETVKLMNQSVANIELDPEADDYDIDKSSLNHFTYFYASEDAPGYTFVPALWPYKKLLKVYFIPINRFEPLIRNTDEDADSVELKTVPVRLQTFKTKYVQAAVSVGSYSEAETFEHRMDESATDIRQPIAMRLIMSGQSDTAEYITKLYVGYYKGFFSGEDNWLAPYTDKKEYYTDAQRMVINPLGTSLRLKEVVQNSAAMSMHKIDYRMEYSVKFLYDGMPDVRSVFLIKGVPYLCKQIQAKFTVEGMSREKTGKFYRLLQF